MRILVNVFGLVSFCWALVTFGIFVKSAALEPVARQILSEENFKDAALTNLIDAANAIPEFTVAFPSFSRSKAIVLIRYLESAIEKVDPRAIDSRMVTTKAAIETSLLLTPSDSFLWLVLFWLENTQDGYKPDNLKLLTSSYDLAPREGWIVLRRNRMALALFNQLDQPTQDKVLAEFAALVQNGVLTGAALNLVGPGWSNRQRLLESLTDVDFGQREQFARMLSREGFRVKVPGIVDLEQRPWR